MSKINNTAADVRTKLVDYKVYDSRNAAISQTTEENSGSLNVIMNADNDDYALYVGDRHIASGYGLSSLGALRSLEEFLKDENIQKLLSGETINIDPGEEEPGSDPTTPVSVEIEDSSVNVNNSTISFVNGKLTAKSWITLYDVEVVLSNGDKLYQGGTYEYSALDNLSISKINFWYDIKNPELNTLKWLINFDLNGITSTDVQGIFSIGTQFTVNADGTKRYIPLNVNTALNKENSIEYEYPINLIITDGASSFTFLHICTIKYKYPVFISTSESLSDISLNDTSDTRWGYYDTKHELSLSIPNVTDETYVYVWVPILLTEKGFRIIYEQSNVACSFEMNLRNIIISNQVSGTSSTAAYNRYRSPWRYSGNMTWIIK
ncbi:MAG: hypothetical protein IJH39_09355 [Clostridia bacterium]|nr:hypothetical protein [Clostridia bacterium]